MKAVILYRPRSDHAREVTDFSRDYLRRTGKKLDLIDIDTRDGQAKARAYDITQYPAILATREDNGQALEVWQGRPLPMIDTVSYYDDK